MASLSVQTTSPLVATERMRPTTARFGCPPLVRTRSAGRAISASQPPWPSAEIPWSTQSGTESNVE